MNKIEFFELLKEVKMNTDIMSANLKRLEERREQLEVVETLLMYFNKEEICPIENKEIYVQPMLVIENGQIKLKALRPYEYIDGVKHRCKERALEVTNASLDIIAKSNVDIERLKKFLVREALPKFLNGIDEISFYYIISKRIMEKIKK